jgi:hypothetical protein
LESQQNTARRQLAVQSKHNEDQTELKREELALARDKNKIEAKASEARNKYFEAHADLMSRTSDKNGKPYKNLTDADEKAIDFYNKRISELSSLRLKLADDKLNLDPERDAKIAELDKNILDLSNSGLAILSKALGRELRAPKSKSKVAIENFQYPDSTPGGTKNDYDQREREMTLGSFEDDQSAIPPIMKKGDPASAVVGGLVPWATGAAEYLRKQTGK